MYAKYAAIVLAVIVATAQANSAFLQSQLFRNLLEKQERWDELGLSAYVNTYVDDTISMIVPFIANNGLDPMPLPDIEEGFSVRPVLITYSARLRIHDGHMSGLVNVARSGDQMVFFFAKMLRVRLHLQFTDLEFAYKYLVKVMNIGPTGGISGSLTRFVINIDLLFDFNNDEIHVQEFSMSDVGRLRVRLSGNILTDWLVNPVVRVFVTIFNNTIIKVVEANIATAVTGAVGFINHNIKLVLNIIESYN